MSRKEWRKKCRRRPFHHRQGQGKLGYFWKHVFLKAKSGPNLGGVVNPDTGAAILDSERQKLTYLDSEQGEAFGDADSATGRNDAVLGFVAGRPQPIQRMAPIEFAAAICGAGSIRPFADDCTSGRDTAQGNGLGVLERAPAN